MTAPRPQGRGHRWGRTPNWSNWSGCRSRRPRTFDMPTITAVMLDELEARVAEGLATTCPRRFIGGCTAITCKRPFPTGEFMPKPGFLDICRSDTLGSAPQAQFASPIHGPSLLRTVSHGKSRQPQDQADLDADTGHYYVTKKNSRTKTEKLIKKKYDPIARSTSSSRKQNQVIGALGNRRTAPAHRRKLPAFARAIAARLDRLRRRNGGRPEAAHARRPLAPLPNRPTPRTR